MKQELTLESALALISADKRAVVQPFLQEVFNFYGPVDMEPGTGYLSEFTRGLASYTPPIAQPRIRIVAGHDEEEALIHELLHLYMPLRHGGYAFYFPDLNPVLGELSDLVQNVVEHDLMLDLFLSFGYSREKFQRVTPDADYRRERKQGPAYWLYTYLRHVMLLRHLPEAEHARLRTSMTSMRKVALSRFPNLGSGFQRVRGWVEARDYHNMATYPRVLAQLFAIINHGTPTRYMRPESNRLLSIHNL